ncbi:calcium-binding protein [Albibacillus kandeliae]|uniref:calcium-binding protein n=1 Tax=Albibacillus kandeliae TaxID=2174228 RepID=UPI000D68D9E7|nr:calcium-binding protein [Albibacillus kandeliae]
MTKSVIKYLQPEPLYYADVFSFATLGYYSFDSEDWADALPGRKAAKSITVTTDFSYQIHNQPDYEAEVGYKFIGDFSKSGGVWSGTIDRVQFLSDGDVVGTVVLNSGVDISRVANVAGSGLIWNELTATGLRGSFTSTTDYFNGSVGDDILNLGGGNDQVNASRGNDVVRGGGGHDMIDGYDGDDRLFGGGGNDHLYGKGGNDRLFGQAGKDTFYSDGQGTNVWTGGKGADMFQVSSLNWDKTSPTTVTDFNARQGDKLDLTEFTPLLYNEVDEIRFIGKRAFSATEGVLEVRMEDGLVSIDSTGDGIADWGLDLEGLTSFKATKTNWIELPDWWDFS